MKKVLLIAALPLALMFQSCTKDEIETIAALPKNSKQMEAVKEFPQEVPSLLTDGAQATSTPSAGSKFGSNAGSVTRNFFVGRFVDPNTPPQFFQVCTKQENIEAAYGLSINCIEYTLEERYYYNSIYLSVTLRKAINHQVMESLVDKCIQSTVSSANTGIFTANEKHDVNVLTKSLESGLRNILGDALGEVNFRIEGGYGN